MFYYDLYVYLHRDDDILALLPIDPIVGNGSDTPHFLSPTTTGQNLF